MSISSLQLDAFVRVAKTRSFSGAANALHITQSALSQRILNLEEDLQATLLIRETGGVRLTAIGEKLLKYCSAKDSLEEEFLHGFRSKGRETLSGVARIGGFSTWNRSVLLPKLGAFGRAHPHVLVELTTREIRELPTLLRSGQVDLIFSPQPIDKPDYENILAGHEEYVLIEPRHHKARESVFIDHDEQDTTTADFFKAQRSPPAQYSRVYFDEIYSVIDAVSEGFGRAVVPRHLIAGNEDVALVRGLQPLRVPVYLVRFRQAFYTKLQERLLGALG